LTQSVDGIGGIESFVAESETAADVEVVLRRVGIGLEARHRSMLERPAAKRLQIRRRPSAAPRRRKASGKEEN